ncbi:hypothetical protein ACFC26_41255 [Kitasatospora purpeofusca]|uniref:hypothetical protein n=1 Tax=Kitasatospora purpeofusca TaxID=67352 RepID=UPI0035D879BA
MHHRPITRVPFPELGIAAESLHEWVATALFSSEIPTDRLALTARQLQIRPVVRALVWRLTEGERSELVRTAAEADPLAAEERLTVCRSVTEDAAEWIDLQVWTVAR